MAKKRNSGSEPGTWLTKELLHSDAFRSLSSAHKDIWLFILTLRKYGKDTRGRYDYTRVQNKNSLKVPTIAIQDFFNGPAWKMSMPSHNADTIRRAFKKFMAVGFLSIVHQGGNGPGDQSIYQLEDSWKRWKVGDPACFTKKGMTREKGFCQPKSGVFYTSDRKK
ncbi:hypothetical protein [Desulfofustis limnaeus]|uniref:Uncharacterized protein n=1 Tax=Desulfofustis limnaeus TaxID=2740163 RepID=A0ABN6M6J2_9BACT|nr:hypothetical protein [Desulfofustis limnaeus]BDD88462.1 hypothetical protein DPPLL_28270 [Desulfofustis limnaeus]